MSESKTKKKPLDRLKERSIYKIEKAKEEKNIVEERKKKGILPKVLGYCRVSTTGQLEEGDSLDSQEEKIRDFCKQRGYECVNVFRECISGSIHYTNRPLLKHIIRELENGEIDGMVIYKLDRLSRSIKDTIEILNKFASNNWLFNEIRNGLSTDSSIARFQVHLFSALAELERSQIIERVNEVVAYKRSKNHLLGQCPFGKNIVLKEGVKVLVDNEEELRCIDRMKELRAEKIKDSKNRLKPRSYTEICRILEKEGWKNKVGNNCFFPSTVKRILKNIEQYCPVNELPIITEEEHQQNFEERKVQKEERKVKGILKSHHEGVHKESQPLQ